LKTNRASATAYLIAESAVFLSQNEAVKSLLPPKTIELSKIFAGSRPLSNKLVYLAKQRKILRPFFNALENLVIPGIQLHYSVRKRRLEEIALDALAKGCQQIVVFGAGFDTLALRLHKNFPDVSFIEIDYPATQTVKKSVVEKHQLANDNLKFIALDLTENSLTETILDADYFRPNQKTLFVAEGLLMYLAESEIENLFDFVRQNGAKKSQFAFTFMERQANNKIAFRNSSKLVDYWLKIRGEPFRSGFNRSELIAFLTKKHFTLESLDSAETFRQRYLTAPALRNLPLAEGESLCLAVVN
jgi:methyltransferase (TIGR00027 family)